MARPSIMKLPLFGVTLALSGVLASACSSGSALNGGGGGGPGGPPSSVDPPAGGDDDPANQAPHSLGSIVLGEAHASGDAGKSTPIVSATFVPDASQLVSCKTKLEAGCELQKIAMCAKNATSKTGCDANEACTVNDRLDPEQSAHRAVGREVAPGHGVA